MFIQMPSSVRMEFVIPPRNLTFFDLLTFVFYTSLRRMSRKNFAILKKIISGHEKVPGQTAGDMKTMGHRTRTRLRRRAACTR